MIALTPTHRPDSAFFWSALQTDSEFTPEDPLALDYLAQQVGLFLLPTLTTRSARAQSFAVVLYGLHLAELALDVYGLPNDDAVRRRLFERWERFWALAVMESRQGEIRRGDPDAMRGVRGAVRAWYGGERPLPLDFQLISRQLELGSLGAYLSPLRQSALVTPGTLRPSPAAEEILAAFWGEPQDHSHARRYEEFAMSALDLSRDKIERKHRNLTLATVGERSRLTSLYAPQARTAQQRRLYEALFERARDATTLPVATLIREAALDGVQDPAVILDGAIEQRWGTVDSSLIELLETARRFGVVMHELVTTFDRTYVALADAGWQAPLGDVAAASLDDDALPRLRRACVDLLGAPQAARLRTLPTHGRAFMRMLEDLRDATPATAVERILAYHLSVQRDRQRGDAWIRLQAGELVLQLTTYNAQPAANRFPTYKFGVVRQLLADVGVLPVSAVSGSDTESAS